MTSQLQGFSHKLKGQSHVSRYPNKNAWEYHITHIPMTTKP